MTSPYPRAYDRGYERPATTGGLSIADRRTVNALARDVAIIRRWVGFAGALLVAVLCGAAVTVVLVVGDLAGWWHLVLR